MGGRKQTYRRDTEPPLPWGTASSRVIVLSPTSLDVSDQFRLEGSVVQKTLLSTHGVCSDSALLCSGTGRTAEGPWWNPVTAARRDPSPEAHAASTTRARGLPPRGGHCAWLLFSRRWPPSLPQSLEAPWLPEQEVEPSPRPTGRRESSAAAAGVA